MNVINLFIHGQNKPLPACYPHRIKIALLKPHWENLA